MNMYYVNSTYILYICTTIQIEYTFNYMDSNFKSFLRGIAPKNLLNLFVCIKLNFFLPILLSLYDLFPWLI